MTAKLLTIRSFAVLCVLLMSSCLDVREEYWLHDDGSAKAELRYDLPNSATLAFGGVEQMEAQISDLLESRPELTTFTRKVTQTDERTRIEVTAHIGNALDLKDLSDRESLSKLPLAAQQMAGHVAAEVHGLSLHLQRTISLAKAIPALTFFPPAQFQNHRLVYIIHLPEPATSSNATETWDQGKSLMWEIPLAKAVQAPVITSFVVPISSGAWIAGVAIAVALLLGGLWLAVRRLKKKTLLIDGH